MTGFLIGAVCGVFIFVIMPPIEHAGMYFINFFAGFALLALGFLLHVFVHELGHLVAGKISGYGFVSIRFFNVIFIKEGDRLARKKFNIPGAPGQCLMSPPEPVNGRYPFALYTLGGCLMNFIVSALFLALCFAFSASASWMLLPPAAAGFLLGFLNIAPHTLGGVPTDGHNLMTLGKNDAARRALWMMLNANAQITRGFRFRDMPDSQFALPHGANLNDALVASAEILRFNRMMDRREFAEAKELAERLINTVDKMPAIHKNELLCELLFLELIGERRKETIESLHDADLKKYIKATSSYMSRQRLLYAHAKLFLNDEAEAAKALEKFDKACLSTPFAGEIDSECELIELVKVSNA